MLGAKYIAKKEAHKIMGAEYMAKKEAHKINVELIEGHKKCRGSRNCDQPAEVNMTWLVHSDGLDKPAVRTGGNFCANCASFIWDKAYPVNVSSSPFSRDSTIIKALDGQGKNNQTTREELRKTAD